MWHTLHALIQDLHQFAKERFTVLTFVCMLATMTISRPTVCLLKLPTTYAVALSFAECNCLHTRTTRLPRKPFCKPLLIYQHGNTGDHVDLQVIISGPVSDATVSDLLNATHGVWAPDKAVILINPEDSADMEFWQQHNPEAFAMVKQHYQSHHRAPAGSDVGAAEASQGTGNSSEAVGTAADMGLDDSTGPDKPAFPATAFVCQNFACQAPTSDPEKVRNLLGQQTGSQQPRVQKFNLV